MSHNAVMVRKKKTPGDRHRPSRMVRVKEALAAQVDLLVERRATDLTEEVNRAVREMLEREGLWPVKKRPSPAEEADGG